jgi:hypothetical protein
VVDSGPAVDPGPAVDLDPAVDPGPAADLVLTLDLVLAADPRLADHAAPSSLQDVLDRFMRPSCTPAQGDIEGSDFPR